MSGTLDGKNLQKFSVTLDKLTPEPAKKSLLTSTVNSLSTNHTHDHTKIVRTALNADTLDGHDVVLGLTDNTPTHLITNEYLKAYLESLDIDIGVSMTVSGRDLTDGDSTVDVGHSLQLSVELSRPAEGNEVISLYGDSGDAVPVFTWNNSAPVGATTLNWEDANTRYRTTEDRTITPKVVWTVDDVTDEAVGDPITIAGQPGIQLASVTAYDGTSDSESDPLLESGHNYLKVRVNFAMVSVGGEPITCDPGVAGVSAITSAIPAGVNAFTFNFSDIPDTSRATTDSSLVASVTGLNTLTSPWTLGAAVTLNTGPLTINSSLEIYTTSTGWA